MIDWATIDEQEYAALKSYAEFVGMTAAEFAAAKLAALKRAEITFHRNYERVGGLDIERLRIDETIDPARALIAIQRRGAIDRLAHFGKRLSKHVSKYDGLYPINWERLKLRAQLTGVDVHQANWLREYLQGIPVLHPFGANIDAFVDFQPRSTPRIALSAHLHNVFEVALVPMLLNILSEDGKCSPLKRRLLTEELAHAASQVIVSSALTYTHSSVRELDRFWHTEHPYHWILQHTEIVDTIGMIIACAANDFIWLHELAHVVFSHCGENPKHEEVQADNLAFNCVLEELRQSDGKGDFFASLGAAGIALVFHFFEIVEALFKNGVSETHPPAIVRRQLLSLTVGQALAKDELQNYDGLAQLLEVLFLVARSNVATPFCEQTVKAGAAALVGCPFAVIPAVGKPYINALRSKE